MTWTKRYRPTTLDQVIGQDKAVATIRAYIDNGGLGGRAFWLSGPTGTGKSTLADIMARTIADDWMIREYGTARDLTTDELKEIERTSFLAGWGKGGRAVIVNEAHGLGKRQIEPLLGLIDSGKIPNHVVWIFTTTWAGDNWLEDASIDAGALKGRCKQIRLTNQGLAKAGADLLVRIAKDNGFDLDPATATRLMRDAGNSIRAAVEAAEDWSMESITKGA